ncbi:MAG TPA: VOC family protein [Pseudonocardiaceae bacterium]|jgi:predicted enzyme related to lactoylglutathione lyase|nr:VOC family protein [Pseudonocardiaceae bacterium]
MAAPRIFRLVIPVDDIGAAVAFYGAITGSPGERVWRNRHYFRCGDVLLAPVEPGPDNRDFRPADDQRIIYFAVDDLPATMAAVRAAGPGEIDDEIGEQAWGERSFYARDASGNRLCFVAADTVYTGGQLSE